jgi:hypothetical protein
MNIEFLKATPLKELLKAVRKEKKPIVFSAKSDDSIQQVLQVYFDIVSIFSSN